jgi:hypothetical protein
MGLPVGAGGRRSFLHMFLPPWPDAYPGAPRTTVAFRQQHNHWLESLEGGGLWDHDRAHGLSARELDRFEEAAA